MCVQTTKSTIFKFTLIYFRCSHTKLTRSFKNLCPYRKPNIKRVGPSQMLFRFKDKDFFIGRILYKRCKLKSNHRWILVIGLIGKCKSHNNIILCC